MYKYVCISVFVSVSITWPSQTHYMHKLKQASPLGYFVIAFSSALIKFSFHDNYKWSALKPSREILCKTTVIPARYKCVCGSCLWCWKPPCSIISVGFMCLFFEGLPVAVLAYLVTFTMWSKKKTENWVAGQ